MENLDNEEKRKVIKEYIDNFITYLEDFDENEYMGYHCPIDGYDKIEVKSWWSIKNELIERLNDSYYIEELFKKQKH